LGLIFHDPLRQNSFQSKRRPFESFVNVFNEVRSDGSNGSSAIATLLSLISTPGATKTTAGAVDAATGIRRGAAVSRQEQELLRSWSAATRAWDISALMSD
jgi:hypothetical protein